jgi:hypothetical protein
LCMSLNSFLSLMSIWDFAFSGICKIQRSILNQWQKFNKLEHQIHATTLQPIPPSL